MYIRRKVFSHLVDSNGEERLYSTTKYTMIQNEGSIKYFSKSNDEDEDTEEKKPRKKGIGKKVAIGTGIATGTTLAAAKGYQLLKRYKNTDEKGCAYEMNKLDKFGHDLQDGVKTGIDKVKQHLKRKK